MYCQFNEEDILDKIISDNCKKVCFEVGAWDGLKNSNTAKLVRHLGWKGVFVECSKHGSNIKNNYKGFDIEVHKTKCTPENINTLVPDDIGLVSIDIDGNDYYLFEALNKNPLIVIIEYNPLRKGDSVMPYDPNWGKGSTLDGEKFFRSFGASKDALIRLGKEKGYSLIDSNQSNLFFIKDS